MPKVYDNNGTTSTEIKKIYDFNGSTATQIKNAYDWNGSSATKVYASVVSGTIWNNGPGTLNSSWLGIQNGYASALPDIVAGKALTFNNGLKGTTFFGTAARSANGVKMEAGQKVSFTHSALNFKAADANTTNSYVGIYVVLFTSVLSSLDFDTPTQIAKFQNAGVKAGVQNGYVDSSSSWTAAAATRTLTVSTTGTYYPAIVLAGYDIQLTSALTVNNVTLT